MISGLYARVSTSKQEEQDTIESQLEEIKRRIEEDRNVIPEKNIFTDDGWTGEVLQRPGLDAMRDASQSGDFQVLYVYDRGRLSRVFAYQEIIIEELINLGIKFVTLHDVKAETPEERVLQAMQGVFHEYERIKIVERFRRGKLYKARNGILINGNSLYGYNYVKKTDTEPTHYEINEQQAKVVKDIFHWVVNEGLSLREVIRRLCDLGIPPRKGKSQFWTKGPILRILQCESYFDGVVYYNKSESCVAKKPIKNTKYKKVKRTSKKMRPREEWIPIKVPVLMKDRTIFERVQKILDLNKRYSSKNKKHNYLLTGIVFCECGTRRAGDGQNKHGHFYYRCAERIYNFPSTDNKCQIPGVNANILDGMVWKELMKLVKDPELLTKKVKDVLEKRMTSSVYNQQAQKLEGHIIKIQQEEERYTKAYGAGTLEFEQFKELMKDAKNRKQDYQDRLKSLEASISSEGALANIQVSEVLEEANKILREIDYTDKAKVVKTLVDRVVIKDGGLVSVCGHIPLLTQKLGYEPESRNCRVAECGEVDSF